MFSRFGSLFLLTLTFVSCTRKHPEGVRLFYGACKVEVLSQTSGAEILIDGVPVGEEHVTVDIPCGEKQVIVEKEGFVPYKAYLPVTAAQALKVTVKLEKVKSHSDYALSSLLIDQVRAGQPLVAPGANAEEKALVTQINDQRKSVEAASFTTAAPSEASAGGAAGQQSWNSVEDWR